MTIDNQSEPLSPPISDTEIFKQKPSERRPRIIEMAAADAESIQAGAQLYRGQKEAFQNLSPFFEGLSYISLQSAPTEIASSLDRNPNLNSKGKKTELDKGKKDIQTIQEFNFFISHSSSADNIRPATPDQISSTPAETLIQNYQSHEKNVAQNISRAIGIAQASIEAGDTRVLVETISSFPDIAYHPDLRQKINDHLTAAATNPDQLNSIQTQAKNELLIPFSSSRLPENTSTSEGINDPQVLETIQNLSDLVYVSLGHQTEKSIVDAVNSGKTGGFVSVNQEGFRSFINLLSKETGDTNTQEALRLISIPDEKSVNPITVPATLAEFAASSDFQKVDLKTQRKIFSFLAGSLHTLPTSDQGKIAEIISVVESGNSPLAAELSKNLLQKFSQKPETANISSLVESQKASKPKIPEAQPETISPPQAEIPQPEPIIEAPKSETPQVSREQALATVNSNEYLAQINSGNQELTSTGNPEVDDMVKAAVTMAETLLKNSPPEKNNSGFFGFGKKANTFSSEQFAQISKQINSLSTPFSDPEAESGRQIQSLSFKILQAKMITHNQTTNK